MVKRDCELAVKTGAKVDIQHISSGVAVDYVKEAKEKRCECLRRGVSTPFHVDRRGRIKIRNTGKNEPATSNRRRPSEDHQRITGRYDRDHCDRPRPTLQRRERQTIRSGTKCITGIETSLALGVTELVEKGYLSMMQLLEKMTINPAKLYNMEQGRLQEGKPADVVLFDPEEEWEVKEYKSKATNSPFTGWKLKRKSKIYESVMARS